MKSSPVYQTPMNTQNQSSMSQDYLKLMSIDESMDTQDNQQMQDVVSKQVQLEKMKLPETTDALEMIAEDPGFAIEFLTNIKQM